MADDSVPKRLYDELKAERDKYFCESIELRKDLEKHQRSETILVAWNILEDFQNKYLKSFLLTDNPNNTCNSQDIPEAYRKFLSPNQKSFKKVKNKILSMLTNTEIGIEDFIKRISAMYSVCSSYIHAYKQEMLYSKAEVSAVINISARLQDIDKRILDVLNTCL